MSNYRCITNKWVKKVTALFLLFIASGFYYHFFVQDQTTSARETKNQVRSNASTPSFQTLRPRIESTTAINSTMKFDEKFIEKLSRDLVQKTENKLPKERRALPKTCSNKLVRGNSCEKTGCLQVELPESPRDRLEQLVKPSVLHPSLHYRHVIESMGRSVSGFYDIIMVTGASSNHYEESKALLYNLKANVFPHLKNFTFIYYDLGLTKEEREDLSAICQCRMLNFPFEQFPRHVSILKCYTWKPIIVSAHASRCNVVFWVDASIRFWNKPSLVEELLQRVRVRGVQCGANQMIIPYLTMQEMFHFFGDEACAYLPYTEAMGGFLMLLNEPLIKWAVLEPWVACALNESCMCLNHVKDPILSGDGCWKRKKAYQYGVCHRFDQSALGIIVRKLFLDKSHHLLLENLKKRYVQVKRGDKWKSKH